MSRTKRARSPAAEREVELHSPTRRRIRFNKPRVHARPLSCVYDSSDDDSQPSSDDDTTSSNVDAGFVIIFEEPAASPRPQSPVVARQQGASHTTDRSDTTPSTPPSTPPTVNATQDESPPAPSWTSAYTFPMSRPPVEPNPEPIADRLRRLVREARGDQSNLKPGSDQDHAHNGAAHRQTFSVVLSKEDAYIQSSAHLRDMIAEGRLGVYVDSGNHNIIRVADCAPDTHPSEEGSATSTSQPKTTTRCVQVQPPPEQRRPSLPAPN